MPLTYSLRSAADLHEKLKRDATALTEEITGDRLFNFAVTALHLREWIGKDPTTEGAVRERLTHAESDRHLLLCCDLANASKHFVQGKKGLLSDASSEQGFGKGRYGMGAFGVGEESILLTMTDGSTLNAIELRDHVTALYAFIFGESGDLPGQSEAAT